MIEDKKTTNVADAVNEAFSADHKRRRQRLLKSLRKSNKALKKAVIRANKAGVADIALTKCLESLTAVTKSYKKLFGATKKTRK